MKTSHQVQTTCCIVGGGPGGMFLGYLLARAGVDVIVLEKHADFLRDFRGDTIHPSTFELTHELGLLEEFLAITDFRASRLKLNFEGKEVAGPTFSHLNTECNFVGFAPQWNVLNLLASRGKEFPTFDLRMQTNAFDLIRENDRVVGVRCEDTNGEYDIRALLVVAADGRSSTLRAATDLKVIEHGIPIDVLWFRLDRPTNDDGHTLGWVKDGRALVTIPRKDYYQIAMIIQKGSLDAIKAKGLDDFQQSIGIVCPALKEAAIRLESWNDVKLLTVQMNRMKKWYEPGLLFIGDAAHAMSPVGGVGINLAIQDAVAAANVLFDDLLLGHASEANLKAIQKRREPAARKTQRFQAFVHSQLFGKAASPGQPFSLPTYLRIAIRLLGPMIRHIRGRVVGLGFQQEHIRSKLLARFTESNG